MTKNNYWEKRALENENRVRTIAKVGKEEIEANFSETLTKIQKEILYWYNRFAKNNGITKAEAYRLMNSRELDELNWNVREYVKKGIENAITQMPDVAKQLENASAKFHITRLDALKTQVLSMCDKMFADTEKSVKECLSEVYKDTYYHTAYDYQDGVGIYADFAKIDDNFLGRILEKPWADDGSNFSERIWGKYRPQLVNRLHKDLTDCVIRGRNPNEYTESIAKDFKVSMNQASNLVMTEYSYFNSKATHDCHEKLDVEEFEVCETLDSGTCRTCQNIDGKHFPMSEFSIGVNAPPFHCGCRGTTIPYFDDEFTQNEKRAYRGEDGKTHYTSAKNYKEWKEEFVKESYENSDESIVSTKDTAKNVQNYKPVVLSKESDNMQRRGNNIITRKVTTANNDIYVSDSVNLKRKQLHNIDSNISKVKELLDIKDRDNVPAIYVINDNEMGTNALASYNPVKNVMFFNEKIGIKEELLKLQEQFAEKDNEVSTYLHEFIHWQDRQKYVAKNGVISSGAEYDKYVSELNKKCKKELDKLEGKGYNIKEISKYASKEYKDKNYDEVYTEYRVKQMLRR